VNQHAACSIETAPAEPERTRFYLGVVVFMFLAILGALYWTILRDLVWQWWEDPNYSHGFVVPIVSGFVVWQRRKELAALPRQGSWLGLPVLVIGVVGLILGDVASELFLMRSSLILIVSGLVLFHLGSVIFRALAFPLAFLLFMVPLPAVLFYAIAFPLQKLAAWNAVAALELLGVPVLLDGNVIHLSQIRLGVTEACSGIRSLVSLLALAVASAYLMTAPHWAKALFVASVIPITIAANAGRVVTTGLVGQWIGAQYATGVYHTFSGYLIFALACAALLAVHGLIRFAGHRPRTRSA